MNTKQLSGFIGSIILFAGVFAPIMSVPIIGSINYYQNGKGFGIAVMILAVASFVLVLIKKYEGLWLTGLGSFSVVLFTFINFQLKMSQMKSQMVSNFAGNPLNIFVDMAMQSVQMLWGWAVLVVGAGLLIASGALKENTD